MITKKGSVIKISGDKTIKVEVHDSKSHGKYGKSFKVTTKFLVHDEKGEAKVGDVVEIEQSNPISKRKSFSLKLIQN